MENLGGVFHVSSVLADTNLKPPLVLTEGHFSHFITDKTKGIVHSGFQFTNSLYCVVVNFRFYEAPDEKVIDGEVREAGQPGHGGRPRPIHLLGKVPLRHSLTSL